MRQRVVRLALVSGVIVLALLLLLATCGGKQSPKDDGRPAKPPRSTSFAAHQLTVPPAYDTTRGWEIDDASPDYAVAEATSRIAYLERVGDTRFRIRTLDPATGRHGWDGAPWRPLFAPDRFPRLLSVAKDDVEYFVTWSYGKLEPEAMRPSDSIVSLDVYNAADGSRKRVEVPWADAPTVSAAGPGILISDGKAVSAVVDPANGDVVQVPPGSLGYPKGCPNCRKLTEVRAVTDRGLLVSGAKEFWVRGGWFSRKVAPKGTDPASGVPASVARDHILAKWRKKKGAKDAGTHDVWAVHDAATGKAVAQVRCRRPAIAPVEDPQLISSPDGRFLIAGRLAFDLEEKTAYCFEEPDGTQPLTLTTVSDDGTAYGASSARDTTDALAGGGTPVVVDLTTAAPEDLAPNVRLPGGETAGAGLFRWTDGKDTPHLIGYPHRDE
ncbi:hypothetical protein [Streptomyces lushanensis]|uniref:hypothetical protein n=1 Tax=Streptomyces lushanensis TaxID=1434255 RepID=UPI00082D787E|nr:hypothetical protein [Streptomyces lushanensis]